jgi:hypothetical protein
MQKRTQLGGVHRATTPRRPVSFRQRTQLPEAGRRGGVRRAWRQGPVDGAKRTKFPDGPGEFPVLGWRWRPIYPIIPLFYYSTIPVPCRSCETKPIPRFRIADCGLRIQDGPAAGHLPARARAGGLYETKPIPGLAGRDEGQMRKTKPNVGRMGYLGEDARGKRAKRTQFPGRSPVGRGYRDVGQGAIVRNKPNLAGRPEPGGRNMQDKPNLPRAGSPGPIDHAEQSQLGWPRYPNIPAFQPDADCAKQTQFRATPGRTRPEGRGTRHKCAKRSQFGRSRAPDAQPTKSRWSIVQNKPNLRACREAPMGSII